LLQPLNLTFIQHSKLTELASGRSTIIFAGDYGFIGYQSSSTPPPPRTSANYTASKTAEYTFPRIITLKINSNSQGGRILVFLAEFSLKPPLVFQNSVLHFYLGKGIFQELRILSYIN